MNTADENTWRTAVVLQGGGAMGAYEYGVLKALYETRSKRLGRPFRPAVVAGISIGAITAAVLVGADQDPIETLGEVWAEDFTVSGPFPEVPPAFFPTMVPEFHQYLAMFLAMFGNRGMYQVDATNFLAPWAMTSVYSTSPLTSTLARHVNFDKLNASDTHLVLGAIDVKTGMFTAFDNRTPGKPIHAENVVASGSLPVVFPMTRIHDQCYWDGGVLWNTPLSPAINALELTENGSRDIKRELIVVELFPVETDKVPTDLKGILTRLVQLLFSSKLKLDASLFDKVDSYITLSDKIDEALKDSDQRAILNDPGYQQLRQHRKIDALKVITCNLPDEMSNPADFSRSTLEYRIKKGYEEALSRGIDNPAHLTRPPQL